MPRMFSFRQFELKIAHIAPGISVEGIHARREKEPLISSRESPRKARMSAKKYDENRGATEQRKHSRDLSCFSRA